MFAKTPQGLFALALLISLAAACASPSTAPDPARQSTTLPPVWAVGPDRLLELDPTVQTPLNILPMYGGVDRGSIPFQDWADEKLVTGTAEAFGSQEEASAAFAQKGLDFYNEDDYETAMKRLNQAWLMDESNPDVFYGFAAVYQDHGNHAEAGEFAAKSLELGLKDPMRLIDCAYMLANKAASGTVPSEAEIKRVQARLRPIVAQALDTVKPTERAYVQLLAFKTQMIIADFDAAWTSWDKLQEMGETIPDSYRKALERQPRNGQ